MSAVARLCLGMGKRVSGSDLRSSETVVELKGLGAEVSIGHSEANIRDAEVVVYTEDISETAPGRVETEEARRQGIPCLPYSKALGELMEGGYGIGVTGTNGKSTTTAILGLILEAAELDPTVVVGSKISLKNSSGKFQANARLGGGKFFVAESDEYHRHMLDNRPKMVVLTNVAEDHLDYYKGLADIMDAFDAYVATLPPDGVIVYNADDHHAVEVGRKAACHKLTFGVDHYADLQAINLKPGEGKQVFDLHYKDEMIGTVELAVPGKFNVLNALGASLAALHLGVRPETVIATLNGYAGIWRRFEIAGKREGLTIVSDYGHHPAGVSGTIAAAREFFPGKKIITVFQPHHRNRTKALFEEFVDALLPAEDCVVVEIFDVTGREHGEDISSRLIVDEINKKGGRAVYAKDLAEAETLIRERAAAGTEVAVMMGAGDIDQAARRIVSKVGISK